MSHLKDSAPLLSWLSQGLPSQIATSSRTTVELFPSTALHTLVKSTEDTVINFLRLLEKLFRVTPLVQAEGYCEQQKIYEALRHAALRLQLFSLSMQSEKRTLPEKSRHQAAGDCASTCVR